MAEPVTLRTERLLLRPWHPEDRDLFAALNADAEVMAHFPAPLTRGQSDDLADRIEADLASQGWGLWATEVVAGDDAPVAFIGFVGLARPAFDPSMVEVGWRLTRTAWGHGYATEGATAALRHAFDVIGLTEVVSFTSRANLRSQRVMERIGMHRDPARDFDHPSIDPVAHPELVRHVMWVTERGAPAATR